MWASVPDSVWYHTSKIADQFLRSEFNMNIEDSNLFDKVKAFLFANKNKLLYKVSFSDEYINKVCEDLLHLFQKELRYRIDD